MQVKIYIRVYRFSKDSFSIGERVVELPCIPRKGDHVCILEDSEGEKVKDVYLVVGETLPICVIE